MSKPTLYKIKPEYFEDFGPEADETTLITFAEIKRLALGWAKPLGEVRRMCEHADMDGEEEN